MTTLNIGFPSALDVNLVYGKDFVRIQSLLSNTIILETSNLFEFLQFLRLWNCEIHGITYVQ